MPITHAQYRDKPAHRCKPPRWDPYKIKSIEWTCKTCGDRWQGYVDYVQVNHFYGGHSVVYEPKWANLSAAARWKHNRPWRRVWRWLRGKMST